MSKLEILKDMVEKHTGVESEADNQTEALEELLEVEFGGTGGSGRNSLSILETKFVDILALESAEGPFSQTSPHQMYDCYIGPLPGINGDDAYGLIMNDAVVYANTESSWSTFMDSPACPITNYTNQYLGDTGSIGIYLKGDDWYPVMVFVHEEDVNTAINIGGPGGTTNVTFPSAGLWVYSYNSKVIVSHIGKKELKCSNENLVPFVPGVAYAEGETVTAEEFNSLLTALIAAGVMIDSRNDF